VAGANGANAFFDLFEAAEFDLRRAASCIRSESFGAILIAEEVGVGAEFGVEVGVGAFAAKKIALKAGEVCEEAHDGTPSRLGASWIPVRGR
jgi:hypothetical protein